ncbi:MAG: DUF5681 domain-containing protein [bacterium]
MPTKGTRGWIPNPTGKGGFKKGQCGNPGGRPKAIQNVLELAREHSEEALITLIEIMQNENEKASTRISAASEILNRAIGRPTHSLDLLEEGNRGLKLAEVGQTRENILKKITNTKI